MSNIGLSCTRLVSRIYRGIEIHCKIKAENSLKQRTLGSRLDSKGNEIKGCAILTFLTRRCLKPSRKKLIYFCYLCLSVFYDGRHCHCGAFPYSEQYSKYARSPSRNILYLCIINFSLMLASMAFIPLRPEWPAPYKKKQKFLGKEIIDSYIQVE